MTSFLSSLAHDDLAPATLRGYRYDLRHFLAWRSTVQDAPFTIEGLAEYDLIASADQTRELNRMDGQNQQLRTVTEAVLALADELRKGSINRIMGMSDIELGL